MAQRDENGKFIKGGKGGPGRPPKQREERFYEITLSTVTYAKWEKVVSKALDQAIHGDTSARKWLSDYLIGPPTQKTEITGKDGEKLIPNERYDRAISTLSDVIRESISGEGAE